MHQMSWERSHCLSIPHKENHDHEGSRHYSSKEETTSSHSSSESEDELKGVESSEEVYPHEEGDLLMVRRLLGGQSCDLSQSQRENIFYQDAKF